MLNAEGKPVAGVNVTSSTLTRTRSKNPIYGRATETDEEGRYRFGAAAGSLPARHPPRGILATRPPDERLRAHVLPGRARAEEAEVLEKRAGEELKGRDLRLPPRRAESSQISGRVVWADGTPRRQRARELQGRDLRRLPHELYGARTDAEGRFRLNGYEGQTFVVEAVSDRPLVGEGPMERARPLTVSLSEQPAPLELVITKLR